MIKKLLPFFLLAFIFTNSTYAQTDIAGTYTGKVTVKLGEILASIPELQELINNQFGGEPIIPNVPVVFEETATNTYTLGLPFDLGSEFPFEIGDVELRDIMATASGNSIRLGKRDLGTGPKIPIPEEYKSVFQQAGINADNIEMFYRFDQGDITKDKLTFQISLLLHIAEDAYLTLIVIEFEQSYPVSIEEYADNSLNIYSSFNSDIIKIQGADNNTYSIYNVNGALIQSGNVESGLVNVSNITSGIYFIKAGNKTAKFIK